MDPNDIKSHIPGQWWGAAGNTLPDAEHCGPTCVVLEVPRVGAVRFLMNPWSYYVHGGQNFAWAVTKAKRAPADGQGWRSPVDLAAFDRGAMTIGMPTPMRAKTVGGLSA